MSMVLPVLLTNVMLISAVLEIEQADAAEVIDGASCSNPTNKTLTRNSHLRFTEILQNETGMTAKIESEVRLI